MAGNDFAEFKERILAELKRLNDVADQQQQQIIQNRLELARFEHMRKWLVAAVGTGVTATAAFIVDLIKSK